MSNNNFIYLIAEMQEKFVTELEANAQYVFYTLSLVKSTTFSLSSYQHMLNMLFIIIMLIIIYILYRDIIFRDASNLKRCRNIIDNIAVNENYDKKFYYRIYVVNKRDTKDILKNYIFRIDYDFQKNKTIFKVNNINNNFTTTNIERAFYYFDLLKLDSSYLTHAQDDNPALYIDKKIITNGDYKFIPVSSDDTKIFNDVFSKKLAYFTKKYGFDRFNTDLYPVFDIINAVEYKKNDIVI